VADEDKPWDSDQAMARARTAFREVFATDTGRYVLALILGELGFGARALEEEARVAQNVAWRILERYFCIKPDALEDVTNALLDIPVDLSADLKL
tara:strand:+ start:2185 stop:2469 length:285 start_codon:yes stop_codon:yes gene_type:complete